MQLSDKGAAFIARHEGFVSKAYRDPVGVWTIGTGFTNRSRVFSKYWRKLHGRPMRAGDTITSQQNAAILRKAADEEYGAAVIRHINPRAQHQYDGATSVCFNCGPGAAKWKWAKALAGGDVAGSARLLRKTAVTAKGRRLRGLVRRRAEEADLIEHEIYGRHGKPADRAGNGDEAARALNRDYQAKLARLGYDPGPADGVYGGKTKAAVLKFQTAHPDLVNDGLLGRATMAQIDRSLAKRSKPKTGAAVGTAVVAGAGAAVEVLSPDWTLWAVGGVAVLVVATVALFIWKYREDL